MIRIMLFSMLYLLIIECRTNNQNKSIIEDSLIITSQNFKVDTNIYKMTKIFFDSLANKNSIYELFIDKVYEDKTILTFKAKPKYSNYLLINKPLFIYYYNKTNPVYVYTGIEDLFKGDMKNINSDLVKNDTTSNYYFCMSFTLNKDSFYIDKPCHKPFGINVKQLPQPYINMDKYKEL